MHRHGSTSIQYSVRVRSVLLHSPIPATLYTIHSFRCVTFLLPERYNPAVHNISGCIYISLAVLIYLRLYLYISGCTYISLAVLIYLRLYLYISGCTYISLAVLIYNRLYLYITGCIYIYILLYLHISGCIYISPVLNNFYPNCSP